MIVKTRIIPCVYKDPTDVRLVKLADVKIKMAFTENENLKEAMDSAEKFLCDGRPFDEEKLKVLSSGAIGEEKEAFCAIYDILGI
ncbi:MAG: hypothetical protein IJS47_05435 [Clostridia bacterium]|nr:hypothetical protein [Clostridia bacterium]